MEEMVIKNYYDRLTTEERTDFIYNVCKLCDMSIPTFYKKLRTGTFKKSEEKLVADNLICA